MSKTSLWFYLSIPILLSVITLGFVAKYRMVTPHIEFYVITILSFTLISVIGLIAGFKTTGHRNKNLFGSIALTITLSKIIVSILLVVIYLKLYPEISNWFILPFFLIYLYFTIYETFALIQIGRYPYA